MKRNVNICAHRGLSAYMPENTLPAFWAGIAAGAAEVEFDLRETSDGVAIAMHDDRVDRSTDGTGAVETMTWEKIMSLATKLPTTGDYTAIRVPRLEHILDVLGGHCVMNIHIKKPGLNGSLVKQTIHQIKSRGLQRHCYIAGGANVLQAVMDEDCSIERCNLERQGYASMATIAHEYGCARVQLKHTQSQEELLIEIARAREYHIRCNYYFSDEAQNAQALYKEGIDTLLSNKTDIVRAAMESFNTMENEKRMVDNE